MYHGSPVCYFIVAMPECDTCSQEHSGGLATVQALPDGNNGGVVDDPTVQAFDVAESVVCVAGHRVAVTPCELNLVAHRAPAGLP